MDRVKGSRDRQINRQTETPRTEEEEEEKKKADRLRVTD